MKIVTKTPSTKTQLMLESLRKTTEQTLERKRRLGHYAVMWENGKPLLQGEDAPPPSDEAIAHDSEDTEPNRLLA